MNYLDDLNDSQRDAVTYIEGPALVIAGAGSGKTRVLTYKIAYLLEHGLQASRILALTFTNKAAREMKERIAHIVGAEISRYLWMGTFHSVAARILRQEAEHLGYTHDFSIYDTTDSKSLIKQIIKERGLDEKKYKSNVVLGRISDAKNVLQSPEQYAQNTDCLKRDKSEQMMEMSSLYQQYQSRLKQANSMDFDDLLVNLCYLFRDHREVLEKYQKMFEYVLVDEYQDTNYAQYMIVRYLAEPQNRVCVVGDDAQSIYSFRGADIHNILTFQNGYSNARLFKLERNYRSTQTIVNAANSLIHKNKGQIYKEVYSEKSIGDRIELRGYVSDREEAEGVAKLIAADKRLRGKSYNDIAVLYRTNAQSRAFENELRKQGIAYRIYGGMSFYQRKEIKDAICYFRLAANPLDNEAFNRIINTPARGIGDTTLRKIADTAYEHGIAFLDVATHPMECNLGVNARMQKNLMQFAYLMQELQEDIETMDAFSFADTVMRRSGLLSAAAQDLTPEGIDRKQNLDELLTGIREFVDQRTEQGIDFTPMADFLGEVALLTDQDEKTDDLTPRVTLMTVHAAKGLEFPYVYIAGLEENLFPSAFCNSPREIEEERRLMYVALTRAMERCTMTYAQQRFKNGTINLSNPSRFLSDIDNRYVQKVETTTSWTPQWHSGSSWGESTKTITITKTETITGTETASRPTGNLTRVSAGAAGEKRSITSDFTHGDRVQHRVFGIGTVIEVYNENDNDKIDIQFETVGKKTLLLQYAKLEKV